MNNNLSVHAEKRSKQRAVPPLIMHWLWEYGAEVHDKRGCTVRYFDRSAKRRLEKAVGREVVKRLDDKLSCYIVEGDGRIITAGHRRRRIKQS